MENKIHRSALLIGSVLGMLGVVIGAFGAHALKDLLLANGKQVVFETGVRYQFYHALLLLIIGLIGDHGVKIWLTRAFYSLFAGIILFSGSLYVLSIFNITVFGAITPFGGVLLIIGWICFLMSVVRQPNIK